MACFKLLYYHSMREKIRQVVSMNRTMSGVKRENCSLSRFTFQTRIEL